MSEPLNPLAAGVASALKSLRARAGLRADRLSESDPAVGMLSGLVPVKELVGDGVPTGDAIVQAVTNAAKTLEPTHSIVADVSLGLELSSSEMADSQLYAVDLGSRRTALIENWGRVHALRSAPDPGQAPTMRTLRLEVETAALTALAVALTTASLVAVPGVRTSVPSMDNTLAGVGGSIPGTRDGTFKGTPGGSPRGTTSLMRGSSPLLLDEFQRIAGALRGALAVDDHGRKLGWSHDLRKGPRPHSPLSTSFAIRSLMLIENFLAADLREVVLWLTDVGLSHGGYKARSQNQPRPEATATVLGTLQLINGTADFGEQFSVMKKGLGAFEKTRPLILSTVLETSAQLGYDSDLTRSLTEDLLAARQSFGSLQLWPEKSEEGRNVPIPSIAHTARAVHALTMARAARPRGQPREALEAEAEAAIDMAAAWLAEQDDLGNVSEVVDRTLGEEAERCYVRHFTAAWVVKALVCAGLPVSHPSVSRAMAQIWSYYDYDAALWAWTNGDLPVWMTLDAIEALRVASVATSIPVG
jgi:hypothetical protein